MWEGKVKQDIMLNDRQIGLSLRAKALFLAAIILLIDQVTKALSTHFLNFSSRVKIFEGFDLTLSHNTGAAFGFLNDASGWQRWFFVTFAVIIIIGIFFWLGKLKNKDSWEAFALALILGGALGNLWDRIAYGYVVDFILLYYKAFPPFPTFNIADSAVCMGTFMFAIDLFRKK
jgi:signal peptidase II